MCEKLYEEGNGNVENIRRFVYYTESLMSKVVVRLKKLESDGYEKTKTKLKA